jgi:SEC-C motif domain protein
MRSRYSAFALGLPEYLLTTWHPSTRPETLELDPALQWRRLDILAASRGGMLDSEGTVEFRAHFRGAAERGTLHELSRFTRADGAWTYVDGTVYAD